MNSCHHLESYMARDICPGVLRIRANEEEKVPRKKTDILQSLSYKPFPWSVL